MKKIVYFVLAVIGITLFQSCYTTRKNTDDQFVKQDIRIYKRIGDDYRLRNILRIYIILRMANSVYEIYTEGGEGIIGKFSLRNDTINLYHEYQLGYLDSTINLSKINRKDTIPEFYPTKFVVRKDSLIDITCYQDAPKYLTGYSRPRENFILVK